jgi:two-component system, sensor histidine kinase
MPPAESPAVLASPAGPATVQALLPVPRTVVDQVRALYVQTPATLTGHALGMVLVVVIFWSMSQAQGLGLAMRSWLAVGVSLWCLRLLHYLHFLRHRREGAEVQRRWHPAWVLLVLCQASVWGAAVWLFWGLGTPYHKVSLLLIAYTYCLASVQLLATQWRVFLAFLALVLLPTLLRIATDDSEPWHLQLAWVLSLMFAMTLVMGRTYSTALGYALRLKARTEELAEQLRAQVIVAEEARRAAEAANRAKTQFFAAASHDLRQPLHAMGLFAEALRQRNHDPEVAALVNSINESVDALEGLFGELLDITRIDTGGVDVNPAPVRMRELFSRLRLHFEPTAFEKGLMLSFRGEQHVAHADPVLLERVLRNLVSNAIRYTDDGGVLVSCRLRHTPDGPRLLLQVWDSGIGIGEASLPRIFDEFFQAQSNRPLQAHHRKGLGLGLAIVKRLSVLMGAPIAVRSRVGHGTVFSLQVAVGRAPRGIDAAPSASKPALGLTLQGRLIWVVEDEAAVRDGLVVVLQAWGATVRACESVEHLETALAGAQHAAPDLLLVDYRLPQGRTGIEALTLLRQHWPHQVLPAIVITGSTMGGHEHEAEAHQFHLLIKPVLPNKLRAMIAFKLGVRAAPMQQKAC